MKASTAVIAIVTLPTRYEALVADLVAQWQVDRADITRLGLSDKKATIGIAEVQKWLRELYRTPRGPVRLAVLTDAERLTDAANNALLKTLEEPPQRTQIVLLLTRDTLLPTIRSRVQLQYDHEGTAMEQVVSVVPHSVSDIISTADDVAKKKATVPFIGELLAAVRADVRSGRLSAQAAAAIALRVNRFSPGMSAKVMVESVLLTYREGRHDS